MLTVCLLGYGYWGPNLARNLAESDAFELTAIADRDPARLALAARRYPLADCRQDADIAACEAVVIATPVSSHFTLARRALGNGQHVLVAKPLAHTLEQAVELQRLAGEQHLVLMTDHTFVHTGAVRELAYLAGTFGTPLYYDSQRVNLGLFQSDVDVLWDLAPHDLSIIAAVFPREEPSAVSCVLEDRTGNGQADCAWLTVWHRSGFVAHAHLSWLSPVKVRRAVFVGRLRTAVYDDMEPSEKVKVYDAGVTFKPGPETHAALVDYRTGDCWAPHLSFTEALANEVAEFARLIAVGKLGDVADAEHARASSAGVNVVRLLEAASLSALAGGCRLEL